MTTAQPQRKKLIEVALPLDEINAACKADKDRKTGTIRNLHKWFAPMPLPAWRALIFAALVDDPDDDEKRAYLLDLIKRLVRSGAEVPNDLVVAEARRVIAAQFPNGTPPVMDPFCGGGSTLLEAQRLGLQVQGSDLNPVPTVITRLMVQQLPKIAHRKGISPATTAAGTLALEIADKSAYGGLVRDVLHYAALIREQAWDRLAYVYPSSDVAETPIAWLWARTAVCPNPTCGRETPLLNSMWISQRPGDRAWLTCVVQGESIELLVAREAEEGGGPGSPLKVGDGVFACAACAATLDGPYLRNEGTSGRLGLRMTAVVSEKGGRRVYRAPSLDERQVLKLVRPDEDAVAVPINTAGQSIRVGLYGMNTWSSLVNPRQLLTLETFADLVAANHAQIIADGGDAAWADTITTVLGLGVGKMAQFSSSLALWRTQPQAKTEAALASHNLPMTWDFPEVNVFGTSVGDWRGLIKTALRAVPFAVADAQPGVVSRVDAREASLPVPGLVATDPPYFDAIGYADISDFFYIWHRRALRAVYPDLYATVAAPKQGELTAIASRHEGSKPAAQRYFIDGFTDTFRSLTNSLAADLPMIVVYASKEQKAGKGEETRWSSILSAMIAADLEITGSWPFRGTTEARMVSAGTNAVSSYIAMVCRPRPASAPTISLGDFNRALRRELGSAVRDLQSSSILPVDLGQAAMGPGMQVYSRHRAVLDQAGAPVPVEHALRLINAALSEVLEEQEGELDPYSRFAVAWFERYGWSRAAFGVADQLARPQGTSVDDVVRSGVASYPAPGFVVLLGNGSLDRAWTPASDSRPTAWEAVHHMADRLVDGGGTLEAGRLMGQLGDFRDPARALVYRLHDIAAKKGWAQEQERYNALIGSWSDLLAVAATEMEGLF